MPRQPESLLDDSMFNDADSTAIHYFGHNTSPVILKCVMVPGSSYFEDTQVEAVVFEAEPRLTGIGGLCFAECPLNKTCSLRLVESLVQS
jgi:hypothetical protein